MLSFSIIPVSLNYLPKAHFQCTEPFYQREVEDQIRTAPSATTVEKKKMMELLKRFEEDRPDDNLVASDAAEDDIAVEGSDEENELASKLEGIDLGMWYNSTGYILLITMQLTSPRLRRPGLHPLPPQ